jgi:putative colanic acid biosysnthesis UDP-glucose lipid carrier transferase
MSKKNQLINKTSKYIKLLLLLLDFFVINLSFLLSIYIIYKDYNSNLINNFYSLILFGNLIWILLIGVYNAYQIMRVEPIEKILTRSIKMILSQIIILFLVVYILNFSSIPKLFIIIFSVLFFVFNITLKSMFLYLLFYLRKKGLNNKNVIIIGLNKNSLELKRILKKEVSFGYKILGFFDDDDSFFRTQNDDNIFYLGKIDEIYNYVENNDVHEVYFSTSFESDKKTKELIIFFEKNFIRVKIIPNFKQFTFNRHVKIDFYDDLPILLLRKEPLENLFNKTIKRLFDIFFSAIVIILIMPWLLPIIALIQKLTSKGPLMFIQLRSGQDNKIFKCMKFRTMHVNELSDQVGTIDNDPRITSFGKILRKTRIDELPQFFNVFVGDMSVVGPRPHMLKHTEDYSVIIDEFLVRHYVKPGITGWAQTTGYIDESRKLQEMQDKVKNDIWYIENWSFMLDIKIIFMTVFNIFKGDKNAK